MWQWFKRSSLSLSTEVWNYIKIMKTTFDVDFDSYQAVKQHGNL